MYLSHLHYMNFPLLDEDLEDQELMREVLRIGKFSFK